MSVKTASYNMEDNSSGTPAAAASCPRWVMLDEFGCPRNSVEEAKAAAAAYTSTDLLFHISFLLAAPPASSRFYYGSPDSPSKQDGDGEQVHDVAAVAVHGDALLLEVTTTCTSQKHRPYGAAASTTITDYFVYDNGPARPPSLLLLPGCYFAWQFEHDKKAHGRLSPTSTARKMNTFNTGILRCGEDELLVAQLDLPYKSGEPWDRAELCVLRLGRQEWELKQAVPIIFDDDDLEAGIIKGDEVVRQWQTDTAVPVGDRFLCWVDYRLGFLLCDMAADDEASHKLRYVALPVRPHNMGSYIPCMKYSRNLQASAGGGGAGAAVRFVKVEPRCGCHGRSTCERCFLFTVTTWTLSRLSMEEPMEWVKDGVLDCDELWALPAYKGLPQVKLELPIVSSDDPDVICFMVRDPNFADTTRVWMAEVDTRSKAILSVVPYTDREWPEDQHVAAKLRC